METLIYRLQPGGAFHLGIQGFAREGSALTIPSDTLFGALVTAWAEIGLDVDQLLSTFRGNSPPLQITSTYPYVGQVRLYPRPLLRAPLPPDAQQQARHKARWVSETIWEHMINHLPLGDKDCLLTHENQVWALQQECERFARTPGHSGTNSPLWQVHTIPRVTLDRITNASQVYQVGRATYRSDCGLWFAARFADDTWRSKLEAGLDLLADHGLGGLRSIGHGSFHWECWQDAALVEAAQESDYVVTLARYAPPASEAAALLDPRSLYKLELVPGWFSGGGRNWRRRATRLVAEGALLRKPVGGQLVDVSPTAIKLDHPVYRYGYAFPVAIVPQAVPEAQEVVYG